MYIFGIDCRQENFHWFLLLQFLTDYKLKKGTVQHFFVILLPFPAIHRIVGLSHNIAKNHIKPCNPQKNYRTGDLERYRRTGRYLRSWCWYRRNDHRCWGISEIPESGCKGCGSRACNFTCTFSGKEWPS